MSTRAAEVRAADASPTQAPASRVHGLLESGMDTLIRGLDSDDDEVRLEAAYHAGRIGSPAAIAALSRMAKKDSASENRNQAIASTRGASRPDRRRSFAN